jgi:hypothetical protein
VDLLGADVVSVDGEGHMRARVNDVNFWHGACVELKRRVNCSANVREAARDTGPRGVGVSAAGWAYLAPMSLKD